MVTTITPCITHLCPSLRQVVYGDTDSIMIHTGTKDLNAARQLGASVKREVNKRYRLLEIELDAVFKTMLLLKKKKYAAIKLEPTPEGGVAEVLEAKGLDIVRRDWCPLSKECGQYVLQQVLSGEAGRVGGCRWQAGAWARREGKGGRCCELRGCCRQ